MILKMIFDLIRNLKKKLRNSCGLNFCQHISFKYFLRMTFVRKISMKKSGGLGAIGTNMLITSTLDEVSVSIFEWT